MAGSERMTGADGAWLQMDRPKNPMVVNVLVTLDGSADWSHVEEVLRSRVVERFPRFHQRAVGTPGIIGALDPGRWRDDRHFRFEDHLWRAEIDDPGDDAALHRYVGQAVSHLIDPRRPLWEAHLIDGYRGGSALLLRTHHAMADGMALVHVLRTCTDGDGDGEHVRGHHRGRPRRSAGIAMTAAAARADAISLRRFHRNMAAKTAVLAGRLGGAKVVTRSAPVPLEAVKEAGRPVGATANDVLLAALAGAFRRELGRRGLDPAGVEVAVPVDLRPEDADWDDLGNHFGLVNVRLPVGTEEPERRLRRTKDEMDRIKSTREGELVLGAINVMGYTSPGVEKRWVDLVSRRTSAVVTNIPGPRERRALAGVAVDGITLWVPSSGPVGLGVSFFSYAGEISIGVIADTAILPHADDFLADLLDELTALGATAERSA